MRADYASFDDLFEPFAAGAGIQAPAMHRWTMTAGNGYGTEARTRLGDPDGPFTLTARAWWVRGTVRTPEP